LDPKISTLSTNAKALAVVLSVLLTPIKALRLRYVPLLLVYFAYGSSVFTAIALNFYRYKNAKPKSRS
jgi:hypothetical protein